MNLLSIVIPARDEEGCIASTVEHLHLELQLRGVPHEIIVVDDGSSDRTWEILQSEAARLNAAPNTPKDGATASSIQNPSAADSAQRKRPGFSSKIQNSTTLFPIKSPGPHGFGRAITRGLDAMTGDAVVIMMADESDDCRDVVRYWEKLNEGFDCVFGSRFVKGGGASLTGL